MREMLAKTVLTLVGLALFASASAFGSTIDFSTTSGVVGTWSWPGFGTLSLTDSDLSVDAQNLGVLSVESFTTGAFLGGGGTRTDPYMWAAGGSYTIDGCIPPAFSGCFSEPLFSGQFDDVASLAQGAHHSLVFFDLDVSGTLNSALAAALGVPSGTYSGIVSFNLIPGGTAESGDLTLTSSPTPEPASLVFLGMGLVAVAGLIRYGRHRSSV